MSPGLHVPGVGVLLGAGFAVSLNNQGALAFEAYTDTADGPKQGTFVAAKDNMITTVAMHGTTLRKGVSFDSTRDPWVNDRGDVAFAANTNGDVLTEAIYVKRAATGRIEAIPQPSGFFGAYAP